MTLFEMSLSASVLILAIMVIRAVTLHRVPKRTFLALWGIAVCRLLIPFSVSSRFSVYSLANRLKEVFVTNETALPDMTAISDTWAPPQYDTWAPNAGVWVPPEITAPTAIDTANTVSAGIPPVTVVWLVGLSVCVLFFIITHMRCRRDYKTALPIDNSFILKWLDEHPMRRKVQIRQSDRIVAPLTYGIIRPVVLLPKMTDFSDEAKLQYILTHEFVHIRRLDILSKWLLAAALSVHWFNPLMWVMYVLANRDIEFSCDEAVIQTYGRTAKSAYALTLIGLEETKSGLAPLVNNFSKYAIEERIKAIMKTKKTSLVGILLAVIMVVCTASIFATNAAIATQSNDSADYPAMLQASPSQGVTKNDNKTLVPPVTADTTTPAPATAPALTATTGTTNSAPAAPQSASEATPPVLATSHSASPVRNTSAYPVNESGQTYGSAAGVTTIEALPDLVDVGIGFMYAAELIDSYPKTPEDARSFVSMNWNYAIYKEDGKTICGLTMLYAGLYPEVIKNKYGVLAYPVNANGQTYGSAAGATSVETLPVLLSASPNGYIYTKDLLDSLPKTQEEARAYVDKIESFTLYDVDGKTVVGTTGNGPSLLPVTFTNKYVTPIYPVNENGQTYGKELSWSYILKLDLVRAVGINGEEGYIYKSDTDVYEPENREPIWRNGIPYAYIIPVYENDGVTVIDEFGISFARPLWYTEGMGLDEARDLAEVGHK